MDGENEKDSKYGGEVRGWAGNMEFAPFVVESYGAFGASAQAVRKLAGIAADVGGAVVKSVASYITAVAVALQLHRGNARAVRSCYRTASRAILRCWSRAPARCHGQCPQTAWEWSSLHAPLEHSSAPTHACPTLQAVHRPARRPATPFTDCRPEDSSPPCATIGNAAQ
jgi:hypothetical protein